MWSASQPFIGFLITNFIVRKWKQQNTGFLLLFCIGITSFWRRRVSVQPRSEICFPPSENHWVHLKLNCLPNKRNSIGDHHRRHQIMQAVPLTHAHEGTRQLQRQVLQRTITIVCLCGKERRPTHAPFIGRRKTLWIIDNSRPRHEWKPEPLTANSRTL